LLLFYYDIKIHLRYILSKLLTDLFSPSEISLKTAILRRV
jgi:hypothetical protein